MDPITLLGAFGSVASLISLAREVRRSSGGATAVQVDPAFVAARMEAVASEYRTNPALLAAARKIEDDPVVEAIGKRIVLRRKRAKLLIDSDGDPLSEVDEMVADICKMIAAMRKALGGKLPEKFAEDWEAFECARIV